MPIKPENKSRYPADWKQIRARILDRASDRCEGCGVCNHVIGFRHSSTKQFMELGWGEFGITNRVLSFLGRSPVFKIILTIHHIDHQPENCSEGNLLALCQQCHNRADVGHRKGTRAATLQETKKQIPMEGV